MPRKYGIPIATRTSDRRRVQYQKLAKISTIQSTMKTCQPIGWMSRDSCAIGGG
jgi:hypothetical protein